jgi:hypothetical protein
VVAHAYNPALSLRIITLRLSWAIYQALFEKQNKIKKTEGEGEEENNICI